MPSCSNPVICTIFFLMIILLACDCPKADVDNFPGDQQIEQLAKSGASITSIEAQFSAMDASDLRILVARVQLLRGQQDLVDALSQLSRDLKKVKNQVRGIAKVSILSYNILHNTQPHVSRST